MLDTYRGGYGQALVDMMNFLESHSDMLAYHGIVPRAVNRRIRQILKEQFDHRHDLLDRPQDVRYWMDEKSKRVKITLRHEREGGKKT